MILLRDKSYFAGTLAGLGVGLLVGVHAATTWSWHPGEPPVMILGFGLIAIGTGLRRKWANASCLDA